MLEADLMDVKRQVHDTSSEEFFRPRLRVPSLMTIIRGLEPAPAVARAEQAWAAGCELVEVSLSSVNGAAVLEAVCRRADELGVVAGAGTVTTPTLLRDAQELGASFSVAPGWSPATAAAAAEAAFPHLPGVATASEVQDAFAAGYRYLKLFPATVLGTEWIEAMTGPFPSLRLVAVGGITPLNVREWIRAGAVSVGSTSADIDALLTEIRAVAAS